LPFLVFLAFLGVRSVLPFGPEWEYPLRVVVVAAVLAAVSRTVIDLRPRRALQSAAVVVAVFAIWVGPDLLWPGYRGHWLFSNNVTGSAATSLPGRALASVLFLIFRVAGAVLVVPVVEELFWRGWLMRYLVRPEFEKVALGTYTALSFWATAALFACEHGPYWDVGLLAGIVYGAWMLRTRSLADCILAHAVTNACLAAYVLASGTWQYWL
jgi:CAAX prenyl protease-like protein